VAKVKSCKYSGRRSLTSRCAHRSVQSADLSGSLTRVLLLFRSFDFTYSLTHRPLPGVRHAAGPADHPPAAGVHAGEGGRALHLPHGHRQPQAGGDEGDDRGDAEQHEGAAAGGRSQPAVQRSDADLSTLSPAPSKERFTMLVYFFLPTGIIINSERR